MKTRTFSTGILIALVGTLSTAGGQTPPYPRSPVIQGVQWHFDTHLQFAPGSDQWPMTWADDDGICAAWGDGWGWNKSGSKRSIGVTRITGSPPNLDGADLWGMGPGSGFAKPEALIAFEGTIFMFWTKGDSRHEDDTWTAHSRDLGKTWTLGTSKLLPHASAGFRVRGICQFGRGYQGALDEYLYVYFGFNRQSDLYLARVKKQHIFDATKYEWFRGVSRNEESTWSEALSERKPAFHDENGYIWHVGVSHDPGIKRFLLTKPHYCPGDNRDAVNAADSGVASLGVFDAPTPWGPWTTVYYEDDFKDGRVKFSYMIPTKYISSDGTTFWLAWSGWPEYDNVNFLRGTLRCRDPK